MEDKSDLVQIEELWAEKHPHKTHSFAAPKSEKKTLLIWLIIMTKKQGENLIDTFKLNKKNV